MLLDGSADHFRRHLVTHCSSKIAIFPEFPAPQTPLDPWELAKDSPSTQTLESRDHLRNGVSRREGAEDMDMVGTHLHLFNRDVILLRNIGKEFLYPMLDLSLQD